MKINPYIFRAYDIRGIAQDVDESKIDIDENKANLIGMAFGTFMKKNGAKDIVVGRDSRKTSKSISDAFIQGVIDCGCNVIDIGLCITPFMYFAVCYKGYDGGCMITASHNPPNYNGFKMVFENASPFMPDDIQNILNIIENNEFVLSSEKGEIIYYDGIFNDYINFVKNKISLKRPLKIVLDCGNGTTSLFAPSFFKALGCEVNELYCDLDPNFPNHLPDPLEYENLKDLQKEVLKINADIGLAFDGDGDRLGVVGNDSKIYSGDMLMIFLSDYLIKLYKHEKVKIVIDLKSTQNLKKFIEQNGGIAIESKTGHSFIKSKIRETGALIGGEISGHIFIADDYFGYDDALFAGAKILQVLSLDNKLFSQYFVDIPKTFISPEIKFNCDDDKKFDVVNKLISYFSDKNYQILTIDGVKIYFENNGWALVRASNTSPVLTLRFEAINQDKLNEIQNFVISILNKFI